jgi:3-oxoacyl-[acyl-carrier protein] reductase
MERLTGKVAIVTGSAMGIGKATALKFAREGAKVVVCDVMAEAGQTVVDEITAAGGEAFFVPLDVTSADSVRSMVDAALQRWERIDVLVNNAGITRDAMLVKVKDGEVVDQMGEAAFDSVINVNLKGVFLCTQAVAPVMIRQGGGVILNAASVVGLYGNFGQTNYVATKAGVIGMTRVWAREMGRKGVRVNAVAPGFILTDMVKKMPEKVLAAMQEKVPLNRLGEPEDVANVYAWLASDEASYVNGTVISVDGGIVIGT